MHSLIDENIVETIRSTGNATENLPERIEVMQSHSLPYDRKAENVIITGCQILGSMPKEKQVKIWMLPEFIDVVQREL